ncbi:MAG: ComF family protein [Candidatus Gracilibacteria bacterium]|nr:ComF family protein [Candidatus Gracilibacteria bacterium]
MNIFKILKDILSPKKCYSCGIEGHFLCFSCFKKCKNFEPMCYVCKNPSKNFEIHADCQKGLYYQKVIILTHYSNPVIKRLITDAKFYKRKDIFEDFGKYLTKLFIKYELNVQNKESILVPVPIYYLRKWKRGYNQTEVLGKNISQWTGLEINTTIIKKIKHTQQQSKVGKKLRLDNLKNTFQINNKESEKYKEKKIILIDDVISTGSTLNEVAKTLNTAGFTDITCLVIASD